MPIDLSYDSKDALPEAFREDNVFKELFEEKDGKIVLTGVTGMKTQEDITKLSTSLAKEREAHGTTKQKLGAWGELKADEVLVQLDRIKELELAAGGKLDEESINKIVESRIGQKTGPLERQLKELTTSKETLEQENVGLKTVIETRDRNDFIRSAALDSKAHPTASADIEMTAQIMLEKNEEGQWITKTGIAGITPGLSPKEWLKEMTKLRPHWWPESVGGGGTGGSGGTGGNNPFSHEHWNMTEQGKLFKENPEVAAQLAKAAGTSIGGGRPVPKK